MSTILFLICSWICLDRSMMCCSLSMLHFVRQVLFKWFLDSTGLAVIRPGCGWRNLTQLSKIMWLITVLSWFNRRVQYIFHVGPGRFGQLFSLNKCNHLKTAFCIYLHYLCVILKLVWWSESFNSDKYAKNKKTGRGQKPFHGNVKPYHYSLASTGVSIMKCKSTLCHEVLWCKLTQK